MEWEVDLDRQSSTERQIMERSARAHSRAADSRRSPDQLPAFFGAVKLPEQTAAIPVSG